MNATPEAPSHLYLESDLHDAINMSEIACRLIETASRRNALDERVVGQAEWRMLTFAVYHSNELLLALKGRWDEVDGSNLARKKGGAK